MRKNIGDHVIMDRNSNFTVQIGENVSLPCEVFAPDGSNPPITWVKHYHINGSCRDDKNNYYLTNLPGNSELYDITNVTEEDAGRKSQKPH
jgi:hypothetical protein